MALGEVRAASAFAVVTMVSVPWVTTMRGSSRCRQLATTAWRSASDISRLSIIISVSDAESTRLRHSRSISATWVSLKNRRRVNVVIFFVGTAVKNTDSMYAIAIVRYRRPIEEVVVHQEPHRAYLRKLKADGHPGGRRAARSAFRRNDAAARRPTKSRRRPRRDPRRDPYYQAGMVQYELLAWKW